jgi:hypothetical protein
VTNPPPLPGWSTTPKPEQAPTKQSADFQERADRCHSDFPPHERSQWFDPGSSHPPIVRKLTHAIVAKLEASMSQFRAAPLLRNRAWTCVLIVKSLISPLSLMSLRGTPGRKPAGRPCLQKSIGGADGASAFLGLSATSASVVINSEATEAASCNAVRTTFAGSITPAFTRSWYSPVAALKPQL